MVPSFLKAPSGDPLKLRNEQEPLRYAVARPTTWSGLHCAGPGAKPHYPAAHRGDVDHRHSLPAAAADHHYSAGHLESRAFFHCLNEVAVHLQSSATHLLPDAFIGDNDFSPVPERLNYA